jgi:threonine dehydrogenase-like Zn-dependent dehydrogenase
MRALTVVPGEPNSAALVEVEEPASPPDHLLVETLSIGICGTDREILSGAYGWAPPDSQRLIIGHESIGRVLKAPDGSVFAPGDLVVGIVRRPDPVPCNYCAVGEWDMCSNGQYTERGIKELHGYASERFLLEADFAVKVDPQLGNLGVLIEPASVVAKAWDHAYRLGSLCSGWEPRSALITGAGPVGLLAAMMAVQRQLDVSVFDQVLDGPKPRLVQDLGATYIGGSLPSLDKFAPDIIIECTGAVPVIADVLTRSAASGIVCLAGVSSGKHNFSLDLADVNRRLVLENDTIFGSVNANRAHYVAAAMALSQANREWLSRLITRRVPLADWEKAVQSQPDDVKVVLDFAAA